MITAGRPEVFVHDDEWSISTSDGSLAAHFEHTVAITADGPWVLTAADGGVSGLAAARAGRAAAQAAPAPASASASASARERARAAAGAAGNSGGS
jgi:hypothetical protein